MTGRLVYMVTVVAALAAATPAWGGGWATVGLSSLPDGTRPGEPWVVDLTILQHARTPLTGVQPSVVVTRAGGGGRHEFAAAPTGRPGVYRTRVVFPSAGRWSYVVDDGFTARHSFTPVSIGRAGGSVPRPAPAPADSGGGDDGGSPLVALLAAMAAGALAAWIVVVLQRRRQGGSAEPVRG